MAVEHSVKLRVRFAETDAMQVAYYAEYFVWFEVSRTELFRSVGLPYTEIQKRGFHTPVVQAFADYKASARYDEEVAVRAWVSKVGKSSLRLDYEVRKSPRKQLLCTGHTVHVLIGRDGRPKAIPDDIRKTLSSEGEHGKTSNQLFSWSKPTSAKMGSHRESGKDTQDLRSETSSPES
jgi:acyl-CoA thioester hydrolase